MIAARVASKIAPLGGARMMSSFTLPDLSYDYGLNNILNDYGVLIIDFAIYFPYV
jgi:hypothetical protein